MDRLCSSDVPLFSLADTSVEAKATEIYDGDTFKAIFELFPGKIVKMSCRLGGVDAPEMRGGGVNAIRARNALTELLTNCTTSMPETKARTTRILDEENTKLVTLHCGPFDKFGRLLCRVTVDGGRDVATEMMSRGLCRAYDGGKKEAWTDV